MAKLKYFLPAKTHTNYGPVNALVQVLLFAKLGGNWSSYIPHCSLCGVFVASLQFMSFNLGCSTVIVKKDSWLYHIRNEPAIRTVRDADDISYLLFSDRAVLSITTSFPLWRPPPGLRWCGFAWKCSVFLLVSITVRSQGSTLTLSSLCCLFSCSWRPGTPSTAWTEHWPTGNWKTTCEAWFCALSPSWWVKLSLGFRGFLLGNVSRNPSSGYRHTSYWFHFCYSSTSAGVWVRRGIKQPNTNKRGKS